LIKRYVPWRCRGSRLAGFRRVDRIVVVRYVGSIGTSNGDIDDNEADDANDGNDFRKEKVTRTLQCSCSGWVARAL
jgi:hypothetical protein